MSRYAALAKRVARAEQAATRSKRRLPRLAFFVQRDEAPEASVQGFANADGLMVPRKPGEALPDALARAWRHPDAGTALFAVYIDEPGAETPDLTKPLQH